MRVRPVKRPREKQDRKLAGRPFGKIIFYIPNGPEFPLLRSPLVARGGVRRAVLGLRHGLVELGRADRGRGVRPVDGLPGRLVRRVQADPAEVRVEVEHKADGTDTQMPSMRPTNSSIVTANEIGEERYIILC